jgi:hypothetical protein
LSLLDRGSDPEDDVSYERTITANSYGNTGPHAVKSSPTEATAESAGNAKT